MQSGAERGRSLPATYYELEAALISRSPSAFSSLFLQRFSRLGMRHMLLERANKFLPRATMGGLRGGGSPLGNFSSTVNPANFPVILRNVREKGRKATPQV